jgi:transposase
MPKPTRIDKFSREWLEQKYLVEGLTVIQLAELTGYSPGGLSLALMRIGVTKGGRGSAQRLDVSRDVLYQLHVVEGLTAVKIAGRLGCNHGTISRLIRKFDLDPGRPLVNAKATPPASRDALWKLYWVDELSLSQIGKRFGAQGSTVGRWLRQCDIPRRRWNGGDFRRSYTRDPNRSIREQHEFSNEERAAIQKRDSYRCRMPGCGSAEYLEVNHILPIKFGGSHDP